MRIICATDFSPAARAAATMAAQLAAKLGDTVLLVHVIDPVSMVGLEVTAAAVSWETALREAAEGVATQLAGRTITIAMRAGDEGRLFGSVTAGDVVDAVAAQASIEIDRHDLELANAIKEVGIHEVVVRPHPEVQIPLIIEVTPA